jgi:uncharacterized delta-60 repeat protein
MNTKFYIGICTLFLALFAAAMTGQAAPGSLDTTFGVNGKAVTSIGTNLRAVAHAVAVQADGKIVAAGYSLIGTDPNTRTNDFAVVRYNADGSLDTSFGGGTGIVTTSISIGHDGAWAVAIQSDGKIVVAGEAYVNPDTSTTAFGIARYNTDGSLDTSFDGDGIRTVVVGIRSPAYAMALQSDGKIVVAGDSTAVNGGPISATVVRFNSDGSLDTTFDTDGIAGTQVGSSDNIRTVAIQPDGKILIAGYAFTVTSDIAVVRFNANGSLDTSFDGDGKVTTPIGTSAEYIQSLAIQRDGKIVGAGASVVGATYHSALVRYNTNGSLDTSFDGDGIIVSPGGYQYKSVAIQVNNEIVAAGGGVGGSIAEIVRYKPDGALDTAGSFRWAPTGIVTTTINYIGGVVIQPDGKVLAAGTQNFGSANNPDNRVALLRYLGDPGIDLDYDRDGYSDISVYRPSEGNWYVLGSSAGSMFGVKWGVSTDELAQADYDGDLKTDFAVWRAGSFAYLYVLNSFDNTVRIEQFGQTGDDPSVIADYDGDGKADPAVYRNAAVGQQSYFYYRGSFNNPAGNTTYVPWGTNGDVAARGDYNGDGRFDPTVFRPSNGVWYSLNLTNNTNTATQFGLSTDKLVPADYTGDGKTDHAVFRNGTWYILQSNTGLPQYAYWGLSTDKPVPADYDGDGRADVAVYRDGTWHIQQSTAGDRTISFGLPTDIPTPTAYMP